MKELKQSETRIIKRSEIEFNPLNPKRHSAEKIKTQKKNLKKVGFLGGIVWNENTGHVIDGHRRLQAMDEYYGYELGGDVDYDVKVEATQMTDKEELEQTTYMAAGNSDYELDLIAKYIEKIDYSEIGFSDSELSDILNFADIRVADIEVESIDDALFAAPRGKELYDAPGAIPSGEVSPARSLNALGMIRDSEKGEEEETESDETLREDDKQQRVEHVKSIKAKVREGAFDDTMNTEAYITLSFSSMNAKEDFCEMVGIPTDVKYAKGEDVLSMIQ